MGGSILKVAFGRECAGNTGLKIGSLLYADCHVNLGYLLYPIEVVNSKSHQCHSPLLNNPMSIIQQDIQLAT
jgi:hypothetical protein